MISSARLVIGFFIAVRECLNDSHSDPNPSKLERLSGIKEEADLEAEAEARDFDLSNGVKLMSLTSLFFALLSLLASRK